MRSRQKPGPGRDDGEELSSSPSSFSGKRKSEPGRPREPVRPEVAAGFAEGGSADLLAPGAELAGLVTAVTGAGRDRASGSMPSRAHSAVPVDWRLL
jgi:hypothetical protein